MDGFSDAHLHPTDTDTGAMYRDALQAEVLVGCTARLSEWGPMSAIGDKRLVRSYGIHPWYPDEWDADSHSKLEAILDSDPAAHVGEIGLDSKRGSIGDQMPVFKDQLCLAAEKDRIASIHMVGTEKEVLDALRSAPHGRILLHSYGSDSYLRPFYEEGCYFSISPRIMSRSEVRVKRLLSAIPPDRILTETDAPNFPKGFEGMGPFISELERMSGIADLASLAASNLRRLIDG
jgi:TatD DNase family protein